MEEHGDPIQGAPRISNRFYKLHQRIEAGWHSLKSIVGDITRDRTAQTIKRKFGQKSSATTSSGQSEEATDFEPKPALWRNMVTYS
jgi:hypothetical protein